MHFNLVMIKLLLRVSAVAIIRRRRLFEAGFLLEKMGYKFNLAF